MMSRLLVGVEMASFCEDLLVFISNLLLFSIITKLLFIIYDFVFTDNDNEKMFYLLTVFILCLSASGKL